VNLFLIGWSPPGRADAGAAAGALRDLLERMPLFDPGRIESWLAPSGRVCVAWVAHEPERVGGVRYVDADADGIALFSGRPFAWTGAERADGREPLDAAYYRRPCAEWMATLDGRCCAARYEDRDRTLEIYTDPLGAYPVYRADNRDGCWIGNSAAAVAAASGADELDRSVLASVLAGGWSLSGRPVWVGVDRVARGTVLALAEEGERSVQQLGPGELAALPEAGFDARRAAGLLVAATGALADWPGRPSVVQLSGGRDSRLVLAAARAAGAEVSATTGGSPDAPDVLVARELSAATGIGHVLVRDPGEGLRSRPDHAARVVVLAGGAAISLENAAGYPLEQSSGPLPLWLNGQGGEIAGGYYRPSADGPVAALSAAFADTGGLLCEAGRELVDRELREAVDGLLAGGVASQDVLDVFYVERRMGAWAAAGHGCVEVAKGDTAAPLWSRRLLGEQLAAAAAGGRDRFAEPVLEVLDPELAAMPFASESRAAAGDGPDLSGVVGPVRAAVAAQPSHPAWEVLDRNAVEAALDGDGAWPAVWRLATVFMGVEAA
jgi:hypothetical protein